MMPFINSFNGITNKTNPMSNKLPEEIAGSIEHGAMDYCVTDKTISENSTSYFSIVKSAYTAGATEWALKYETCKQSHANVFKEYVAMKDEADRLRDLLTQRTDQLAGVVRGAERMKKALEIIYRQERSVGRADCYWGDTEYDSISAAAGYNQALDNVSEIAAEALAGKDGEKEVGDE